MVAVDTFRGCDVIGKKETGCLNETGLDGSGNEVAECCDCCDVIPECCDCCNVDATDIAGLISFSTDEVLVVTCVEVFV